ncbi:HD domain-containing protein [Bradyrhizobium sp. USDA 336]|uniref:HD domain-containing protein n=1 Tax=Bradyrhizobium sp. USDA 336 TaxID=3156311 RepID=UPI0038367278
MTLAIVERLLSLIENLGSGPYGSAQLSEFEHAVQAAYLAREAKSGDEMITAALLHDVGTLVVKAAVGHAVVGVDNKHEEIGAAFLNGFFPPAVTEPIRLHVPAKRYLVVVDEAYRNALTAPARRSLERQGGPFTPEQLKAFEALPFAHQAVQLRRWDDLAMTPGGVPAQLHEFRDAVESALRPDIRENLRMLAAA